MTILDYMIYHAPSSRAMEKTLDVLSALAPKDTTVTAALNTLAMFAPNSSSVWMYPLAALVLAVIHGLITRSASMMVGAAFLLCFYTAGNLLLPLTEVPDEKQMVLLTALHLWFSCVASYLFFLCAFASLAKHFIALAWHRYRTADHKVVPPILDNEIVTAPRKKPPVPRPRKTTESTEPEEATISSVRKKPTPRPVRESLVSEEFTV